MSAAALLGRERKILKHVYNRKSQELLRFYNLAFSYENLPEEIPVTFIFKIMSLSDSAASCHCSAESLVRPRSVETDNGLNIESTYKTDKGSSSLDSVSDEESLRRHRHSIPGHLSSYLSFLTSLQQKAAAIVTPAVPVFSTAVISGSTSSPDLRDNFTGLSFSSNIEGLGGVPPIRPLETLHNALSLKQLDAFLEHMALAQFRTPLSSPPKMPSTPKQSRSQPPPLGLQSPSSSIGWSGPPSFVSSSGPSSPNLTTLEFFSHVHQRYDTYMPPSSSPSPQLLLPLNLHSTNTANTTATTTAISSELTTHLSSSITKAFNTSSFVALPMPPISTTDSGEKTSLTDVAVTAATVVENLTDISSFCEKEEALYASFSESSAGEFFDCEGDMGTASAVLPWEGSCPASPSEGSESLGSHSQTEMGSVIERGDTATPDTHSEAQEQESLSSEKFTVEEETLLHI
ncbi:mucin-5AC-like [Penaeus monodon]|uniref:mucin-5AC-like n=1 Tax=Penaeus monodon TaxID=6687 RepID=UPI0018A71F59|nr:mucin-5AC-like [Penaeus monodon]